MRLRLVALPALVGLSVLSVALLFAPACLVAQNGSAYLHDGSALGSCTGTVAREVPSSTCPACDGGKAFLQCLNGTFSECICGASTCGYTVVEEDGAVAEGGRQQSVSAVELDGATCCGDVAVEMRASDCYGCTGQVAFALCENNSLQCGCSCTLPIGFTVIDEGQTCDGGGDSSAGDGGGTESGRGDGGGGEGGAG